MSTCPWKFATPLCVHSLVVTRHRLCKWNSSSTQLCRPPPAGWMVLRTTSSLAQYCWLKTQRPSYKSRRYNQAKLCCFFNYYRLKQQIWWYSCLVNVQFKISIKSKATVIQLQKFKTVYLLCISSFHLAVDYLQIVH